MLAEAGPLSRTPLQTCGISQVPLARGSPSIVDSPKEGLCFLGRPQWRSGDLTVRGDSAQNAEAGREDTAQAGNGSWFRAAVPAEITEATNGRELGKGSSWARPRTP